MQKKKKKINWEFLRVEITWEIQAYMGR